MIKVSIILPCYNVEQYLAHCAETLVNQTLREIEIIFVNDASPDNGIDILRSYEEKYPDKVKVIDLKENMRQGGARNAGMKAATGEYIGFVDPDDFVDLTMFEMMYNAAVENNADIVGCDICRMYTKNGKVTTDEIHNDFDFLVGDIDDEKLKIFLAKKVKFAGITCRIYKRNIITDNGLWFPEHLVYEDNYWGSLPFLYAKRYFHIGKCFYCYISRNDSTIKEKDSPRHYDRTVTMEMLLEKYKQMGIYEKFKDELEYKFIEIYFINSFVIFMTLFSEPDYDKIFEIKNYMEKNFPKYKENIYFKNDKELRKTHFEITKFFSKYSRIMK